MSEKPFILGVNYWPRRKAMYWWSNFDPGEVHEEFTIIRELGLDLARIFQFWEDWQPTPQSVSQKALRNLETVCQVAADLNLKLDVTFFTGHMSGPSWAPSWMLGKDQPMPKGVMQVVNGGSVVDCGYTNPFSDPVTLQAEELLLRTVVSNFVDHPAIGLWSLGNEPDLFAWPPDADIGRTWMRRMTSLIHEIDLNHPVICGLHVPNLTEDNGLRAHEVFTEVDIPAIHGYPSTPTGPAGRWIRILYLMCAP